MSGLWGGRFSGGPADAIASAPPWGIAPSRSAVPAPLAPISAAWPPPNMPRPAYCSSLARESAMSRLRMVSWPIRSAGPNAASSTRSIDSLSGW